MPVQMIELEEVQIMEASDDALEGAYFEPGQQFPKNPMYSSCAAAC